MKTDAFLGDVLAEGVARKVGRALVAPTIRVGCSDQHLKFAGTISARSSTLRALLEDYVESLSRHGFDTIIVIPSHAGNFATVKEVVEDQQARNPRVSVLGYTDTARLFDFLAKLALSVGVSVEAAGAHAGESETSMMMALQGHLVRRDRFQAGYLGPFGPAEFQKVLKEGLSSLSAIGVLGDPTIADAERGTFYPNALIEHMADSVGVQFT